MDDTQNNEDKPMTFADRHAAIDPDPVKELMRRRQLWASAPGENGNALHPDASIIPVDTINAAIRELLERRLHAGVPGTRDLLERFGDA